MGLAKKGMTSYAVINLILLTDIRLISNKTSAYIIYMALLVKISFVQYFTCTVLYLHSTLLVQYFTCTALYLYSISGTTWIEIICKKVSN